MNKAIPLLLVILLISVTIAGCSTGSQVTTPTDKAIKLTIGTTNAVNDLNVNDYYLGIFRGRTTHEGLITLSPDGNFAPCLAKSWETSDAKTWTFHLVDNATWHDGVPVTAADIKFNLEYFPAKIPEYKSHWGQIEAVEAPDDYTVIIKLKTPNSNFLTNLLVMRAVPKHIFQSVNDPTKYNNMNATIGCGPYVFEKFDKDAGTLTFKAYDKYYGGKPVVGEIEIKVFKNQETMIMALEKGEIDTTYMYSNGISYYYVPKLLRSGNVDIMMVNFIGVPAALFFNANRSVCDNTTFRQAVSYALDYEELKNLFTAGYGATPNAGFIPPSTYNYKNTRALVKDVNKSKAMLDAMGMVDKDGDGFRETPDGAKFQPEILARTDVADHPRLAEMIQKYLKAVGIDARIKLVDLSTARTILDTTKTYDLAISRTTPWGMMTWASYGTCYFDVRNIGYSMTKDPKYLALVDRMFNASDDATKKQLAYEIQDYYASEMPAIPLYWCDLIQPYNKKYKGWVVDPMYGILSYGTFFNLHEA